MSGDHLDDDRLGAAFDSGTTRRLIRYARPHLRLFLIAAALVGATTLVDLSIPWLTKTAIDRCILLPWEIIAIPGADPLRDRLLASGAIALDDGRLLIDPAKTARVDIAEAQARGFDGERCLALPERSRVSAAPPGAFTAGARTYLPASALATLQPDQRTALRRPQLDTLSIIGVALLAFVLVRLVTGYCQSALLQLAGNRVMADIREAVFAQVMRLPIGYFDRNAVGRLVTRATNDVSAVNELFTNVLVYLLRDAISIIGVSVIMLAVDVRLALAVLAVSPLVVLISWNFRKRARDIFRDARLKLAKLNAYLQESISGVRTITANAQQARIAQRFGAINQEEYLATMRQVVLNGIYQPLIGLCGTLALAVIIWYGGGAIASHAISVGALVAFTAYVEMLFAPLRDLADKHNVMQAANASAERIFQLLDEPGESVDGDRPASCRGAVEFQDVWFAYREAAADAEPAWVLKGVSFSAVPGERVALIGPTGSGKTTIVNLLLRFHQPQRGRILLDGRDVRELDLHWLRRRFAVVLQDVFLFAGDIRANIALKGDDIDAARVEAAARTTHAHEVILRQPGGYAGTLNERGTVLSVGERQLLSFARALAADPAVLILDEATASIDSQTERLVQDAMERLLQGRTSLTIAHRLSTIRASDRILVLKLGELLESGPHSELMRRDGLYAALVRRQQASEAAEEDAPSA